MNKKYDFAPVLNNEEVQIDFTPSARVSAFIWAKRNNVKIKTKVTEGKLSVKREG